MRSSELLAVVYFLATAAAVLFPVLVSMIRGVRENHLGGILLINGLALAATIFGSFLGFLGAAAAMPLTALLWTVLLAWSFIAPGRKADQLAATRHWQLLEAIKAARAA